MAEITIFFNIKEEPLKEKINEELNWYDTIKQKMLVFNGGKLSFKYKEDDYLVKMGATERQRRGIRSTYRMLPEIEDLIVDNHFKIIKTTNKKEIEEWFYDYNIDHNSEIGSILEDSIIVQVPKNEEDEFFDQLDSNGFMYE